MSDDLKKKDQKDPPFLMVIRIIFVMLMTLITYEWAQILNPYILNEDLYIYSFCGFLISVSLVFIENQIRYAFPQELLVGVFGLMIGLTTSALIQVGLPASVTSELTRILLHLFLGYFGVTIALRYAHRFDFSATKLLTRSEDRLYGAKFLDTSVLIDGRIIEIIEAGFLDGLIIIPTFVVNELQILSDSEDNLKRSKGRRGLDISKRLQKVSRANVENLDEDFPNLHGVDKKLLAITRKYEGQLVTMDYNLHKVAEIDDLPVMNINQLAQSLKTVVLPGEELNVQIIREGKEPHQGVAYLDDGTMVVVENGRKLMGRYVDITVASILQTSAGRMIFAKINGHEDEKSA